jgi:hypothetical protein
MVSRFSQANLFPLEALMSTVQIVRFMLLNGNHVLAPSWCEAKHTGAALMALQALSQIEHNVRVKSDISVDDVLSVMMYGRLVPNTANAELGTAQGSIR